jgi:predicted phage terminase large subunit-like protein
MPSLLDSSTLATAWKLTPAAFAAMASADREVWYPYKWLADISARILPALLKGGARIIINAPPRHGKSKFISKWLPTWYLEHWPDHPIIIASYGGDLASSWSKSIRDEFVMNESCTTQLRTDSRAVSHWLTTDGGGVKSAGIGGPITGRGAKLVIIDDPHKNWEEALSAEARERVIEWYKGTLYTRLEPNASIVLIQTRWHESDLTGYLEAQGGWTVLRYPAIAEDEHDILGRPEGAALCPQRYTAEDLAGIRKEIGSFIFAGLYQQRPAPLLGGIVKKDWIDYYAELPEQIDEWLQTWDLTFKSTGSSYVVGQVWARCAADYYLVDQVRGKMDFIEQVKAIVDLSARWPQAITKVIEDAADAQAVYTTLEQAVPGIVLVPPRGSKEARLAAVSGLFESGHVHLPAQASWVGDFVFELTSFPGSLNDDQVDACAHALSRFTANKGGVDLTGIRLPMSGTRTVTWGE